METKEMIYKWIKPISILLLICLLVALLSPLTAKADTVDKHYYKRNFSYSINGEKLYEGYLLIEAPQNVNVIYAKTQAGNLNNYFLVDGKLYYPQSLECLSHTNSYWMFNAILRAELDGRDMTKYEAPQSACYQYTLCSINNDGSINYYTNRPSIMVNAWLYITSGDMTRTNVPYGSFKWESDVYIGSSNDNALRKEILDNLNLIPDTSKNDKDEFFADMLESPKISYSTYTSGLVDFYSFLIENPSYTPTGIELNVSAAFSNADKSKFGTITIPKDYCSGACKVMGDRHKLEITHENGLDYGGFTLVAVDLADYVGRQIGNDVDITQVFIDARFQKGNIYSKWSNYTLDLTDGTLAGTINKDGQAEDYNNIINGGSGGNISSNTADNKNSLQAIFDWFTDSLESVTLNIGKIFSSFLNLFDYFQQFFVQIGKIFQMVLGSEMGILFEMAFTTVIVIGIIKAVKK